MRQVVKLVGRRAIVSTHCHNDLGLATANTLAGIQAGARQVEVTINGLGERAGNASLEEVVMALRTRPGQFRRRDDQRRHRAAHRHQPPGELPDRHPRSAEQVRSSARNAFAHESGIHQDGFLKNPLTYEIMTPESVGLSGSTLTLGKLSGRAGFDERLRKLGIHVEPDELDRLYGEAISLADRKKQVTDADLLALAEQHADPVPAARRARALGHRQPPGRVEQRQRLALLRRADVPRLLRRQRAGRRAPLGGRQRARADHRRPAAAGRLRPASDRLRRGRPGRGDGQDRRADRRRRRAADLHRARVIDQRGRGQPAAPTWRP